MLFFIRGLTGIPPVFQKDISLPVTSLYMFLSLVVVLSLLFYWLDINERNGKKIWWNPILVLFFWSGTFVLSFTALFGWTPMAWMGIPILLDAVWSWEGYVRHQPFAKKVPFDSNVF